MDALSYYTEERTSDFTSTTHWVKLTTVDVYIRDISLRLTTKHLFNEHRAESVIHNVTPIPTYITYHYVLHDMSYSQCWNFRREQTAWKVTMSPLEDWLLNDAAEHGSESQGTVAVDQRSRDSRGEGNFQMASPVPMRYPSIPGVHLETVR